MQCPKCKYEPTMAEAQRSPADCVSCGVNYEGHARHQANAAAQRAADQKRNANGPVAHVRQAMADHRGATPVVIVDFEMGFGSMVRFLVKLAFAAIPAAIIVALIWAGIIAIFGGIGAILR